MRELISLNDHVNVPPDCPIASFFRALYGVREDTIDSTIPTTEVEPKCIQSNKKALTRYEPN